MHICWIFAVHCNVINVMSYGVSAQLKNNTQYKDTPNYGAPIVDANQVELFRRTTRVGSLRQTPSSSELDQVTFWVKE